MINIYVSILFSLIGSCTPNDSFQVEPIRMVELKCPEIADIIMKMYVENKNQYSWDKSVFVISVEKLKNGYNLKTAILYKQDFGWLLRDKKRKASGYLEINTFPVLVFGDLGEFFSETEDAKMIPWANALPPKITFNNEIKDPPHIFEPIVWIFRFEEGVFKFDKKGYYSVLD